MQKHLLAAAVVFVYSTSAFSACRYDNPADHPNGLEPNQLMPGCPQDVQQYIIRDAQCSILADGAGSQDEAANARNAAQQQQLGCKRLACYRNPILQKYSRDAVVSAALTKALTELNSGTDTWKTEVCAR